MARRGRLLSDRQALLAFSLLVGGWFVFNGIALWEASMPPREDWLDAGPHQVVRLEPTVVDENGTVRQGGGGGNVTTEWTEWPDDWDTEETGPPGSPLFAALGVLQAGGGLALGAYGVFRWSPAVVGEWLPPGRYATDPDADAGGVGGAGEDDGEE